MRGDLTEDYELIKVFRKGGTGKKSTVDELVRTRSNKYRLKKFRKGITARVVDAPSRKLYERVRYYYG